MNSRIDLAADLNDDDDDRLGWSTLSEASDPVRIRPGAMLVAGNRQAQAVVRVVAVDDDGQVHFTVLPGPWRRTVISSAAPWPDCPSGLLAWIQPVRAPGQVQSQNREEAKPGLPRSTKSRPSASCPTPAAPAGDRVADPVQTTAGFWCDRSCM